MFGTRVLGGSRRRTLKIPTWTWAFLQPKGMVGEFLFLGVVSSGPSSLLRSTCLFWIKDSVAAERKHRREDKSKLGCPQMPWEKFDLWVKWKINHETN